MRISVFGIGYVGAVSSACIASDGHEVIAVDIDEHKVGLINEGLSPIVEPGLETVIASAVRDGRLSATCDVEHAVAQTELSLICVGTPSLRSGSLDTSFVTRVVAEIGAAIRVKDARHTVVVRSTTVPGTVGQLIVPELEASSGKSIPGEVGLGYFPEFLREGSAVADYRAPGLVVAGGSDVETQELISLLQPVDAPAIQWLEIAACEAVKYACNAWHATKISFANEIGRVCKAADVDSHSVMTALISDGKLNTSAAYLKPGFAFGGSCLPKDLRALRYRAKELDVEIPLLEAVLRSNEVQITAAFELIERQGLRRVGLYGLTFKPQTDDLRYSPLVELAERLIGKGYELSIYDPVLRLAKVRGTNKAFINEALPHLSRILCESAQEMVENSSLIVVGHGNLSISDGDVIAKSGKTVVDLAKGPEYLTSMKDYKGLAW